MTWVIPTIIFLMSFLLGAIWVDCIDKTKDWNTDEDYECWFGDED